MRVGLIDCDGHNFPSLPLMKLSAWHKTQGDAVEWFEPLDKDFDRVYCAKVFSFSPDYQYPINAREVIFGGSGYCIKRKDNREYYDSGADHALPDEIEHIFPDYSLYKRAAGTAYGFLTRGCPRGCPFCHVAAKEGRQARRVAHIGEFWNGQKNIVLLDPNLLAARERLEILQEIAGTKAAVNFCQGLDIRLFDDDIIRELAKIRIKALHIAYDSMDNSKLIEANIEKYISQTSAATKITCYILTNYSTTLAEDLHRIEFCRRMRINPYPMIYDKQNADPIYRKLQRYCNPYIFWSINSFEEYQKRK